MTDSEPSSGPGARRPVAMVTGASRGIGREIALGRARAGWDLALCGRSEAELHSVAGEVEGLGARAHVAVLDVRDPDAVAGAVARAQAELGTLSALVNNAGAQRVGPALELSADDLDMIVDTNLKGAFLCSQAVARVWVAANVPGVIVNVASAAALVGTTERAAYAASKAGLVMLTRALAREWAEHGIRVNAIAPTFVDTELGRQTLADPTRRRAIESAIPLGRVADYDDILPTVDYLLSDASRFVTGQVIAIDGGLSA